MFTRTHKIILALLVPCGLAYLGFIVFEREVWEPAHRPLVILGGRSGTWRAMVDGAPAECARFGPVGPQARSIRCALVVSAGTHRLAVRDETGRTVHEVSATIESGPRGYVWAPEIPVGYCLRIEESTYVEHPETARMIDAVMIPGSRGGPRATYLDPGFHDVGVIHAWFADPPPAVRSRETTATRRSLRLRRC
ncbi:MAG: hypothetical protein K8H88_06045 [Sandaracinaceae bacterium]|nr:hypothetical protein [Sandaracinaceae bacterium]